MNPNRPVTKLDAVSAMIIWIALAILVFVTRCG